jgi:hypothetical protein
MLIATVLYVGKRLHLDLEPDPDPKLNYGSEHANNFDSIRIRIHNPDSVPGRIRPFVRDKEATSFTFCKGNILYFLF